MVVDINLINKRIDKFREKVIYSKNIINLGKNFYLYKLEDYFFYVDKSIIEEFTQEFTELNF